MGNITEIQPTVIFTPCALSGFAVFAEIPKKHADYCTDMGFFSQQIALILSAQFIYASKWLPDAEICVFITHLCWSQAGD